MLPRSIGGSGGAASSLESPFPLSISANGRCLQTVGGKPWIVRGDAAWLLFTELSSADLDLYLTTRIAQGFNTLVAQASNPVKYTSGSVAPASHGAGGALPFLLNASGGTWNGDPTFANFDAAFGSPNISYWQWIDYVFDRAASFGIALIVDPIYYGFDLGATDGWYQTIGNSVNTQSQCFAFGKYLGERWKRHKNIILSMGTDTFPTPGSETAARIAKLQDGLIAGGMSVPTLAHYARSSGSRDFSAFNAYTNVRGCYVGVSNGATFATNYARIRQEWDASPTMPTFAVESNYDNDPSPGSARTRTQLRTLGYHGCFSTSAGYAGYGNHDVWPFDSTFADWKTELTSQPATLDMARLWGFVTSFSNWQDLQPRNLGSIGTLITAGGGAAQTMGAAHPTSNSDVAVDNTDGQDWVAASATTDGSLLVAYRPPAHSGTFTVDMTKMRGTMVAQWFDPTNAAFSSIGSFPNTGTHAFTAPGTNSGGDTDWVLVLQA